MSFLNLLFLYLVYLPVVVLASLIFRIPVFPKKFSSFFSLKRILPELPKFEKAPILFHASSGEIEYVRSLIREIHKQHPDIPLVLSYSSISALSIGQKIQEPIFLTPLPLDVPWKVSAWIKKLKPRAVIVAKTDFWPFFLKEIRSSNIPLFLVSYSSGMGFWQKLNLQLFTHIFSLNQETFEQLSQKQFPVTLAGDTRIDQTLFRKNQHRVSQNAKNDLTTLVAGSTWPQDENVLLNVISKANDFKFYLAPHEIHGEHITALEKDLADASIAYARLSQNPSDKLQVTIVDSWGQLAELYNLADIAFVGGSFKSKVHSVMEALAWGCPVIVGPHYQNNVEAKVFRDLKFSGWPGVTVVNNADEFTANLQKFNRLTAAQKFEIKLMIQQKLESMAGASLQIYLFLKNWSIFS